MTFDPLHPPPVAVGNLCYPDDISDADAATAAGQQLVCQLSSLSSDTQTVTIPSGFQNAQAGDIILSPSPTDGNDMIATLFAALTPPQHHGHSGMMTANFYEITHCTATAKRITDNLNTDAAGIPTSLNGAMLQYGWPGSLTQSIDDATTTVNLKDPSGVAYPLNSFNTATLGDGFEIIPPLVVKPLPENEVTVRPTLRRAADTARSKGAQYDTHGNLTTSGRCYYSFYAYTDAQISAGFTDAAGPDAGWAQGHSPAACSTFCWLSLKANDVPLVSSSPTEQLSDFSPLAIAGGALVGPATLDGLIYYPAAERLQGGLALYQLFMEQALSQEYGLGTIPGINSLIAGPLADQLLNDFASNNPNLVGSSAWQSPGDGNTVSPDNIIWWNPPYYGYAEPLQYLPQYTEQYTASRWKQVITWGSITGRVTSNGAPVAGAHVFVYLPGGDAVSAADGSFTLTHIGISDGGSTYNLQAQAVLTTDGFSAGVDNGLNGQPVTLTTANPYVVQNIELQGLPQAFRRLDMKYSLNCDHGDDNPFNAHGTQGAGPFTNSVDVNPGNETGSVSYTFDYNGGGYFHCTYEFDVTLGYDLAISLVIKATMYSDGDNSVQTQYTQGPFLVGMGESYSGWSSIENTGTGYHNGPANFTWSVTNNQQTGA